MNQPGKNEQIDQQYSQLMQASMERELTAEELAWIDDLLAQNKAELADFEAVDHLLAKLPDAWKYRVGVLSSLVCLYLGRDNRDAVAGLLKDAVEWNKKRRRVTLRMRVPGSTASTPTITSRNSWTSTLHARRSLGQLSPRIAQCVRKDPRALRRQEFCAKADCGQPRRAATCARR